MKLLLVEDSERLRDNLARGLRAAGFTVDVAGDGVEASGYLAGYAYDFMVLDLGLPRLDGFGVLRALPTGGERPRVLVLSARDQVGDRVEALNAGADDYLVKPFAFEEV
ncbi:MAG TPA: response regulator, partial [Rhodanobacteraceae bacterium]|nr:response regulator [Rhodanobacteraceae bacterium]